MGAQAIDLLLDIGAGGENGGLLVNPVGIEAGGGLHQPGKLLGQAAADQPGNPALAQPGLADEVGDALELALSARCRAWHLRRAACL